MEISRACRRGYRVVAQDEFTLGKCSIDGRRLWSTKGESVHVTRTGSRQNIMVYGAIADDGTRFPSGHKKLGRREDRKGVSHRVRAKHRVPHAARHILRGKGSAGLHAYRLRGRDRTSSGGRVRATACVGDGMDPADGITYSGTGPGQPELERTIAPLECKVMAIADRYKSEGHAFATKLCNAAPNLFTFVRYHRMDPTNNESERAPRRLVLYRRSSQRVRNEDVRRIGIIFTCMMNWRKRGLDMHKMLRGVVGGPKRLL